MAGRIGRLSVSTLFLTTIVLFWTSCSFDSVVTEAIEFLSLPSPVVDVGALPGDGEVLLFWRDPDGDVAQIEISWDPGGDGVRSVEPGIERFTATGLVNDREYTFSLVVVSGEGQRSIPINRSAVPRAESGGTDPTPPPGVAGLVVTESGGSTVVNEDGAGDSFSLVLNTEPVGTVTVTMTPGVQIDLGGGPGNPVTRDFLPGDWDVPQSIGVFAVDDIAYEFGPHSDTISITTVSVDPDYNGLAPTPIVVTVNDNELPLTIYVASENLLYRFEDMLGLNQTTYDGTTGTAFSNGLSAISENAGQIYVVDGNTNLLYRFDDMSGSGQIELAGAPGPAFNNPQGVAEFGGQIYVADFGTNLVHRFNDMTGAGYVGYDGNLGTAFVDPLRVYVDASGIYVVDFSNALLYRFDDMTGLNQEEYNGGAGTAFANPRDVAVDSLGRIYVVDLTTNLVHRFDDMTGLNQVEYGGTAGTAFDNPTGVWIDSLDRIYVTDNGTGLLYRFDDMTGTNQVEYDVTGASGSLSYVYVVGP